MTESNYKKIYILYGRGQHAIYDGLLTIMYNKAFESKEQAEKYKPELKEKMCDGEKYPISFVRKEDADTITFQILELELLPDEDLSPRVIITEGTVKKNINPPPTTERPPPPRSQVASVKK
jgi:hypothetical protein